MSITDQIRSQLDQPLQLCKGGMYSLRNGDRTKEPLRSLNSDGFLKWYQDGWAYSDTGRLYEDSESEFDIVAELVMVEGCLVHGRIVDLTLTREQALKVLDGGELVVTQNGVEVR